MRKIRAKDLQLEVMRLEQDARVLTATYMGDEHSFVTPEYVRDLDRLVKVVDADKTVGVVVLTGGREGRFLTHADPGGLGDMINLPHPEMPAWAIRPFLKFNNAVLGIAPIAKITERFGGGLGLGLVWGVRWKRATLRMNRSSAVYIAAMNGPTMGGGNEIALACDLRYAADTDDMRIGQIEMLVSLIPGGGGTQRIPRMIGAAKALEHILEAKPLSAKDAEKLGLVHRVYPASSLLPEVMKISHRLSRRPAVAVQATKQAIYFGTSLPLKKGLDMELSGFLAAGMSKAMEPTLPAFNEDIENLGKTPLLDYDGPWYEGTRVNQTGLVIKAV